MTVVYVLNKEGKPLMPTTRYCHVRILLKQKKARVVGMNPFTIKFKKFLSTVDAKYFVSESKTL